ncbi:hypothetical protein GCM10015536_47740 [Streptomyces griseomycini]|nr:hypothetical protein GCM10015536_47740 [Streptomyces griseomycini]
MFSVSSLSASACTQHQQLGVARRLDRGDGGRPLDLFAIHPYLRARGAHALLGLLQDAPRQVPLGRVGDLRSAPARAPVPCVQQPQRPSAAYSLVGRPLGGCQALGGTIDSGDNRRKHDIHLP